MMRQKGVKILSKIGVLVTVCKIIAIIMYVSDFFEYREHLIPMHLDKQLYEKYDSIKSIVLTRGLPLKLLLIFSNKMDLIIWKKIG